MLDEPHLRFLDHPTDPKLTLIIDIDHLKKLWGNAVCPHPVKPSSALGMQWVHRGHCFLYTKVLEAVYSRSCFCVKPRSLPAARMPSCVLRNTDSQHVLSALF